MPLSKPREASGQKKDSGAREKWLRWAEQALVDIYPELQAFIVGRLGWQVGEDVVQDAMLGIFKGLAKVRGKSQGEFRAFCFRVAGNKINDALRSKYASRVQRLAPEVIAEVVEAGSETGLSAQDRADLGELLTVIRQAKFPCDEILWSVFVLGMRIGEIAAAYGVSYDAARVRIRRCLAAAEALAKKRS